MIRFPLPQDIPTNVYRLKASHEFQGLTSVGDAWKHTLWWFRGEAHTSSWVPLPVVYNPHEASQPRGDYPGFKLPTFTSRAVSALQNVIVETGELLPLDFSEDNIQAFNVTTVLDDALDIGNTEAGRFSTGDLAHITKYAFNEHAIRDHLVFRIAQQPAGIFVTNKFVALVEGHKLKGFCFQHVWSGNEPLQKAAGLTSEQIMSAGKDIINEKVIEMALSDEGLELLKGTWYKACNYLRVTGQEEPKDIVKRISAAIDVLRTRSIQLEDEANYSAMLGALFGEQVVRAYGWEWTQVGDEVRMPYAVAAPDRSEYIEPLQFIWQFLMDKRKDQVILLTYNMLSQQQPKVNVRTYQQII